MNARELIQNLKSKIELENDITESNIQVDIIGNSKEAKAQVIWEAEGKPKCIEIVAKAVEL